MKKFISGIIRSKTTLASLLVLVGVVVTAGLIRAYGPERKTFTIENSATYVTFNSMTNSPYGDERNFVRIKEVGQPNSTYTDEIKLVPGKKYEVYTFFHNNAAANLNKVAENTRMKVYIPNEIKAGQKVRIDSKISASNANPAEVYDEAYVSTDSDVALRYVEGSAVLNTRFVSNVALPFAEMLNTGTLIGTYGRDGRVPGCNEYSGHVLYQFEVVQPNFTVKKDVRVQGQTTWSNDLKGVKAGDILEYRVVYTNTGSINQMNVSIKDALPTGLTYIEGSAEMRNALTNGYVKLTPAGDKQFKETGWAKLGNYAPASNAILRYSLKVTSEDNMICGYNGYTNIVSAVTENGTKQAEAKVTVLKECKEIQVCELNTKKVITIKEADFKKELHSKNLEDCKIPGKIQVCELATKNIITINENEFKSNLHSKNLNDCKVTPVTPNTPPALPSTGLDAVAGLFGLISLVGSAVYYLNSRKLA